MPFSIPGKLLPALALHFDRIDASFPPSQIAPSVGARMSNRTLVAMIAVLGVGLAVWLTGLRVIVIQPIGAIPKGVTAVVVGLKNVNLIDSPDAICNRKNGGVSLMCRAVTAAAIADAGTILVRLPYSETLFRLTGAPRLDS